MQVFVLDFVAQVHVVKKVWSLLRPTNSIHAKQILAIVRRMPLNAADILDTSERMWRHTWHPEESLDLTRQFK